MLNYLLKRLLYGVPVLLMVTTLVSSIIYVSNVDAAELTFGQRLDSASLALKRQELHLDAPLYRQVGYYLADVSPIATVTLDERARENYRYIPLFGTGENRALVLKRPYLGRSYQSNRRVWDILAETVPRTAVLALLAILIATGIGIVLGVVAALRRDSWVDHLAVVLSVLGYSLPSYVAAMILALIFAYYLGDATGLELSGGLVGINDFGDDEIRWRNVILPALALGIRPVGIVTQLTRSSMLDVLRQDYIRTATAKGLRWRTTVVRHALRNALNPVLTAVTGWFAALLAGAFFVEKVFNYDGLGMATITALQTFDIPVVLGAVLFVAAVFVTVNIVVDLLYAVLDPRVRLR